MSEVDKIKYDDNDDLFSLESQRNKANGTFTTHNEKFKKKNVDNNKDFESENLEDTSLSFEENVRRAVGEVSNWPAWKLKHMRSSFSEKREWKIKGKDYQLENTPLSFEENVRRAVGEVSNWPAWKLKHMRSSFSEKREWKIKGKKY